MKPQPIKRRCQRRSLCLLMFDLTLAVIALLGVLSFSGCGGTFALRTDGTVTYTTPEILKAPIVSQK